MRYAVLFVEGGRMQSSHIHFLEYSFHEILFSAGRVFPSFTTCLSAILAWRIVLIHRFKALLQQGTNVNGIVNDKLRGN